MSNAGKPNSLPTPGPVSAGAFTPKDDRPSVPPRAAGDALPTRSNAGEPLPAPPFDCPAVSGYEVLGELGRGGMGVVYKARHVKLNRLVALKMILAGSHAGAAELARFRSEAEAIARLQHPHIVQIYEIGTHAGLPYFALEFVEGGSLDKKLGSTPRAAKQSAQIVETLARAMQAAHDCGIVHRDLKPANVLVGKGWVLKITDFGLAKKLDGSVQTQSGAVMGTPSYMAPEQAAGHSHAIGPPADVYALGAILYELLTGRPPFKASTTLDTILQVVGNEPVPPRQLQPRTPRDLETICLKCLQKASARRYASAAELAEDLRRFQAGEPIRARPVGGPERAWRWAKRRPAVAALLAALAVTTTASLLGLTVLWLQAEAARGDAVNQGRAAATAKTEAEQKRDEAARAKVEAEKQRDAADQARLEIAKQRDAVTRAKDAAEERRLAARQHLYGAHMSLMQIAWRDRLLDQLQDYLALQTPRDGDPDLRGFECYYFRRLLESSRRTLIGHTDVVTAVAFSADRRHLVSGSKDGAVKVWELATGQEVRTLAGHTGAVVGVAFSPDGGILASVGQDATVPVWDTATGQKLFTLRGRSATPGSIAFRPVPDGRVLAVAGAAQVTLHDARTGKEVGAFAGHGQAATAVTFSPDGKRVASAGADGTLCLWEAATGKELHRQAGVKTRVIQMAFAGAGPRLILASPEGALGIWDPGAGQLRGVFPGYGTAAPVAWRRDVGQVALLSPAETVRVCDAADSRELFALRGHKAPIVSIAYSADGTHLATASADRTVRVWGIALDMEVLDFPGHTNVTQAVAYSPDGKHLATAGAEGTLRVREAATGQEVLLLRPHRATLRQAFAPDQPHHLGGVSAVAFSRDGRLLATGGADGGIALLEAATGKLVHALNGHADAVTGVEFSPDGNWLASSSWDKTVRVWDVTTGGRRHVLSGHTRQATRVAFSPDGKLLASSSWDQTVRLWDPAAGTAVGTLTGFVGSKGSAAAPLDSVVFHPDGKHLAAASNPYAAGGEVKVFDLQARKEVRSLQGHAYGIYQLVYSRDGRRLAAVYCKGAVKVWDSATGQEFFAFQNRTPRPAGSDTIDNLRTDAVHAVAFSPDGQRLAVGCRNSKVLVLDATRPTPELLVQREAYRLVSALYGRLASREAVLDHLRDRTDLSGVLRQEAQARAARYLQKAVQPSR